MGTSLFLSFGVPVPLFHCSTWHFLELPVIWDWDIQSHLSRSLFFERKAKRRWIMVKNDISGLGKNPQARQSAEPIITEIADNNNHKKKNKKRGKSVKYSY